MTDVTMSDLMDLAEAVDMAELDAIVALGELETLIDATLKAGYLEDRAIPQEVGNRIVRLLSLCQQQATKALELQQICEIRTKGLTMQIRGRHFPAGSA